jgi:hypothetical protein
MSGGPKLDNEAGFGRVRAARSLLRNRLPGIPVISAAHQLKCSKNEKPRQERLLAVSMISIFHRGRSSHICPHTVPICMDFAKTGLFTACSLKVVSVII